MELKPCPFCVGEKIKQWCPQCDSGPCSDCPRYMDDCDGRDEEEEDEQAEI